MSDYLTSPAADYSRLRDLLQAGLWRDADEQTSLLMLEIARDLRLARIVSSKLSQRDAEWLAKLDYLTEEDCQEFPCQDLYIIDRLWNQYSDRQFGFSIQAQLWNESGRDYAIFADIVGWRQGSSDSWVFYEDLDFTSNAPEGHLPAAPFYSANLAVGWSAAMASRLRDCQN
ncbi:MAG: GUN4 domain-containing protein [Oscillatoria sp. SIO1A7]|nr:GUN4 domain-containing protein [Oscillatoria sp. SIO1A7]